MVIIGYQYYLIAAMDTFYGIGKNGTLPWNIPDDLKRFSDITKKSKPGTKNMVVMGRKTWESIPVAKRPLKNRINVILTTHYKHFESVPGNLYFIDRSDAVQAIAMECKVDKIFIIGGESVYETFAPLANIAYITKVHGDFNCDIFFPSSVRPCMITEAKSFSNYRFETWHLNRAFDKTVEKEQEREKTIMSAKFDKKKNDHDMGYNNPHDKVYAELVTHVLKNGKKRSDRTGTGTVSIFSPDPLRFDISENVPLLTTKRMAWKGIIKELLWFLRGDTDAKILQKQGVHIWDGNTSREFLDKMGLSYDEGVLGPGYGWSFRRFGAPYDEKYADSRNITKEISKSLGGFDQIEYVENLLKTDPFSRRIYINLWNGNEIKNMALTPCHVAINMYVEEDEDKKQHLSAHVYIRSNDLFLGNPYNIFSYSVFVYIMAKRCNMKPKNLIISFGDAHIYSDHIEAVTEQLSRYSYPPPTLKLNDRIAKVDWSEMTIDDFSVENYVCHPAIKAKMSA